MENADAAVPVESGSPKALCGTGLRARVWVEARHFFSRADAQTHCWLWLHRDDGRVQVLRMEALQFGRDDLLGQLLERLDADEYAPICKDPYFGAVVRLPDAPVVPLPRWAVSWGHPVQRELRAFAATLDAEVLSALGELEVSGPFLGSAANYTRLATLPQPVRAHRLQALKLFPPLVIPLLLDTPEQPELGPRHRLDDAPPPPLADRETAQCAGMLDAIDRGRDLIGALAQHYGVDRALARSPVFRVPWRSARVPREVLRLLAAMPAHARPRGRASLQDRLPALRALPVHRHDARDTARLAQVFARGWDKVWRELELHFQDLVPALRDTRAFLRAALEQAALPPELAALDVESLALAWLLRRGPASLLEASRRWHAQPLVRTLTTDGLPDAVAPLFGTFECECGRAIELTTRAALIEEGETMRHCVGGYWHECVLKPMRIVHLDLPDGRTATAQYDVSSDEHRPAFELEELRGPRNEGCAEDAMLLAERIRDLLNSDRLRSQRAETIRKAARLRAACGPPRQTATRMLDHRSLGELRRVLAYCLKHPPRAPLRDALFSGRIAGLGYAADPRLLDQLWIGEALQLVREPDNPHDSLAVRVDWSGRKLGYVPRPGNGCIAQELDAGTELQAVITAVSFHENWPSVEFAITRV